MIDRVLNYYQTPVIPGFAEHMIRETGLNPSQQQLVRDLRSFTGDTEFYAGLASLPLKKYNATMSAIHQRMMGELLRLAQLGWEAEKNR